MLLKRFVFFVAVGATFLLPITSIAQSNNSSKLRGWKTDLTKHSVSLDELMSGGPPKDGIPAIDNPEFESINSARHWVSAKEPVISLKLAGVAKAYPIQIFIWHEIVNDTIAGKPVTVTFCPLCYSAVAFYRVLDGKPTTFGVSGMLRHSDMVMYDRASETLWQQILAEGIIGKYTGRKLKQLPAQIISFKDFSAAYPNGKVLSRPKGSSRPYGRNPYVGYDNINNRPFLFRGNIDKRLKPMEKIIVVTVGKTTKAYPYATSRKSCVIEDKIENTPVVIFHTGSTVSALDAPKIANSHTVGATGVFSPLVGGKKLHFRCTKKGEILDAGTNSRWTITGKAASGKMKGNELSPIVHGDHFAFAWLSFKPETIIYSKENNP